MLGHVTEDAKIGIALNMLAGVNQLFFQLYNIYIPLIPLTYGK